MKNKKSNEKSSLRPSIKSEFIGQKALMERLMLYVNASKKRHEILDHILLYGPPGLGKTTLAKIIASELGSSLIDVNGAALTSTGDICSILASIKDNEILFIDEIHRIPKKIEEILYSAMEDFKLNVIIGKEQLARTINIDLNEFTLIGATTKFGDLSYPFRDRFGIISKIRYYTKDELVDICLRTGNVLNISIEKEACIAIACRSRGTPRIANKLFKRVRDYADIMNDSYIDLNITLLALKSYGVDSNGLLNTDIEYLKVIEDLFDGGPVGVEAISRALSEDITTLTDVYEPYLLRLGFIKRTSKGRVITSSGRNIIKDVVEEYENK